MKVGHSWQCYHPHLFQTFLCFECVFISKICTIGKLIQNLPNVWGQKSHFWECNYARCEIRLFYYIRGENTTSLAQICLVSRKTSTCWFQINSYAFPTNDAKLHISRNDRVSVVAKLCHYVDHKNRPSDILLIAGDCSK